MSSVEYAGIWSTAGYGRYHSVLLFPGAYPIARDAEAATADGETPSVWSLDPTGTVKGWHLRPKDDKHKFIRETVLVQRRIQFNKKHDVMLDAIAHKITFVTYSQGGLKVSRDMGSPEAEPHSTPLKRSSRCVSAVLTPDAKHIEASALLHIGHMSTFTALSLCSSDVDAAGIEHLENLPSLTTLRLSRCDGVSADCAAAVSRISSLRLLDLSYCSVDAAALRSLSSLSLLEELYLRGCPGVDADGLQFVGGPTMQRLHTLDVAYCQVVTAASVAHLVGLQRLITH